MRRVSTRVFPEPAGAMIARGAASEVTAARWLASRSSSKGVLTLRPYRRGAPRAQEHAGQDAGKPRVVFTASQFRSPRGSLLPTSCHAGRALAGCPLDLS